MTSLRPTVSPLARNWPLLLTSHLPELYMHAHLHTDRKLLLSNRTSSNVMTCFKYLNADQSDNIWRNIGHFTFFKYNKCFSTVKKAKVIQSYIYIAAYRPVNLKFKVVCDKILTVKSDAMWSSFLLAISSSTKTTKDLCFMRSTICIRQTTLKPYWTVFHLHKMVLKSCVRWKQNCLLWRVCWATWRLYDWLHDEAITQEERGGCCWAQLFHSAGGKPQEVIRLLFGKQNPIRCN